MHEYHLGTSFRIRKQITSPEGKTMTHAQRTGTLDTSKQLL